MKNLTKIMALVAAVMIALLVAGTPAAEADAKPLQAGYVKCTTQACSLPYVEDVNKVKGGYAVLIEVCGKPSAVKVELKGKKLKVKRLDAHTWKVTLKKGKVYKLSAKAKGGKWKSVKYGVC